MFYHNNKAEWKEKKAKYWILCTLCVERQCHPSCSAGINSTPRFKVSQICNFFLAKKYCLQTQTRLHNKYLVFTGRSNAFSDIVRSKLSSAHQLGNLLFIHSTALLALCALCLLLDKLCITWQRDGQGSWAEESTALVAGLEDSKREATLFGLSVPACSNLACWLTF